MSEKPRDFDKEYEQAEKARQEQENKIDNPILDDSYGIKLSKAPTEEDLKLFYKKLKETIESYHSYL